MRLKLFTKLNHNPETMPTFGANVVLAAGNLILFTIQFGTRFACLGVLLKPKALPVKPLTKKKGKKRK